MRADVPPDFSAGIILAKGADGTEGTLVAFVFVPGLEGVGDAGARQGFEDNAAIRFKAGVTASAKMASL